MLTNCSKRARGISKKNLSETIKERIWGGHGLTYIIVVELNGWEGEIHVVIPKWLGIIAVSVLLLLELGGGKISEIFL